MKNPKFFVAIMIAILVVVWMVLRTGENLGSDFEKARLKTEADMGLNVKSNTFRFATRPMPPPSAPKWGSFKSEPAPQATVQAPTGDKNEEVLKGLVKKVTDKMKDDKKKQKKVAKSKKKKQGVTLVKAIDSKVNKAMRRLDDGFNSKKQPVVPVAWARIPPKADVSPQSAGADEEKEDVRSYEEWKEAIVERASQEETDKLISQYKADQLGDKRWAFSLAQEMLESDKEDVQKQGVRVLDQLPSEQSFVLLTANKDKHSTEVNTLIKKGLDGYALIQHLGILERSVRSSTMDVQVQAAISIEQSGQLNINSNPQGGRGQRGGEATSTSNTNSTHIRYQATVSTLEQISERITSPTPGKLAIDNTINTLNGLLEGRTTRAQMLSGGF